MSRSRKSLQIQVNTDLLTQVEEILARDTFGEISVQEATRMHFLEIVQTGSYSLRPNKQEITEKEDNHYRFILSDMKQPDQKQLVADNMEDLIDQLAEHEQAD